MDKYALMKRCHCDLQLQVYMYDFKYIDNKTMADEDYFPYTKSFPENYNKLSNPVPVPKHWLGFSYIFSEDYELGMNFDETEMKSKSDRSVNDKIKPFFENNVAIEEEWFQIQI